MERAFARAHIRHVHVQNSCYNTCTCTCTCTHPTYTLTPATHTSIQYAHHCFLFYRPVGALRKSSTILLIEPAEVGHGLHDNDVWQELPPQPCKGGVAHRSQGTLCRRLLVELPRLVFGCAAGEKLDVSTLIPGNSSGKYHCICVCMRAR